MGLYSHHLPTSDTTSYRVSMSRQMMIRPANYTDAGALYRMVRGKLGMSQGMMAGLCGLKRTTYMRREHAKRMYTLQELYELRRLCDLEWSEFGQLIESIVEGK